MIDIKLVVEKVIGSTIRPNRVITKKVILDLLLLGQIGYIDYGE